MNTHHFQKLLAVASPLFLVHCMSFSMPQASQKVIGSSLLLEPFSDASGQPVRASIGQRWTVGSQLLASYEDCGPVNPNSFCS